jgi:hypothetical protein
MPNALIPPGYRAVLMGQAAAIEDLGAFAPLEEGSDEGALFLARLDFAESPTDDALNRLEAALTDAGVEMWPGYDHIVYADAEGAVYLAWMKGLAWMPIIVGILAMMALPLLTGSLVWLIIPQDLKNLITGLVNMGMMLLVIYLMSKLMPSLAPGKERKKVKEARPKQIEEAKREPVSS